MKTKTNCKAGCPTAVEKTINHNETMIGIRVKSALRAGHKPGPTDADGSV